MVVLTTLVGGTTKFSWKPTPPQYAPPSPPHYASTPQPPQPPQLTSSVEQAILNLSKLVGNFIEEQKTVNVQANQRIDIMESSLNQRLDGLQNDLDQFKAHQSIACSSTRRESRGRVPD